MAENSSIEWTDHTFNGWIGCTKVGPGCDHCYAETLATTRLGVEWGVNAARRRTAPSTWNLPRRWDRKAAKDGTRPRVFCSSLADVFDNAVDPSWRRDLGQLIAETPNPEWLLLTKRIGNALDMLIAMFPDGVPKHVRIGATMVNQDEAARDLGKLRAVSVACQLKPFLSIEPMLGAIDLHAADPIWHRFVGWVIAGGESGPGARPMNPQWARDIRDQCAEAGVPFLFKQNGEWVSVSEVEGFQGNEIHEFPDGRCVRRIGKKRAGRTLDGRTHDGFPA